MKILLIGNKPLKKNIAPQLQDFDFIARVNRATNWEQTRTPQTHLWLADLCRPTVFPMFLSLPDAYKSSVKQALLFQENAPHFSLWHVVAVFGETPIINISFDSINIKKYLPLYKDFFHCSYRPSNLVWLLIYLLEKHPKDHIYLTAADITDRSFLATNSIHKDTYKDEEHLLQQLVNNKTITYIPND